MNKKLVTILALCTSVAVSDSYAQNREEGRGQGRGEGRGEGRSNAPGGERGGFGGQRGGPPGGEQGRGGGGPRGGRPNMMTFMPVLIALDADKNGEISGKEMANAAVALKSLDKNNDGKLTEDELRPNRPPGGFGGGRPGGDQQGRDGDRGNMRGGEQGRGGFGGRPGGDQGQGRGGFGGPPQGGGARPDPAEMVERLMAFDKNKDGKLGKDELSERMAGIITRADTDKDGFASKEELTKMAAQRGGGRGGPPGQGGDRGRGGDGGSRRPQFDN